MTDPIALTVGLGVALAVTGVAATVGLRRAGRTARERELRAAAERAELLMQERAVRRARSRSVSDRSLDAPVAPPAEPTGS